MAKNRVIQFVALCIALSCFASASLLTYPLQQMREEERLQLASRDIGDEYTATLRWGISRNQYLQVVASHAIPGEALRDIGADDPWSTLQASLYIAF